MDIRETHLEYSLIGSHLVIANIANLGLKHTDRVAIVYKHDEEKHKHASTVAANRGGNIQYFKDNIENAQKWLLKFYEYQESIINKNKRMWDSSLTLGMTEY